MRIIFLFCVLLFCLSSTSAQSGFCFTPTTALTSGNAPRTLVSADFNSDGKLDIAAANHGANTISVFLGTGTGAFSSSTLYVVGTSTSSTNPRITSGDFNNDGKPDLATANEYGGSMEMSVLLNNGNGTFAAAVSYTAGNNPGFNMPQCIVSNDFNNDNNADLALINMNGIALSVFLGNGTGSFPPCVNYSLSMMPLVMISDNFNNDVYDDLAITGVSSVAILFGSASGTFSPAAYYPNSGFYLTSADLNGDNAKDIATSTGVLLGSSSGTFSAAGNYSTTNGWGIACADYDGDGKKDLALTTSPNVAILQGLGTGYFGSTVSIAANTNPAEMISADFNSDNKPDLAWANGTATFSVSILLNKSFTIAAVASPTMGCSGLTSNFSVSGGATSYTWSNGSNNLATAVTATSSAIYTVMGTNSIGCIATFTIPIVIHPTPSITIVNSNTVLCFGSTAATLTASGASSYTWNNGITSTSIAINPSVNTAFTVTGTSSLGCVGSKTIGVTVHPLPILTLSPNTVQICSGSTATASVSGANTYSWSTGITSASISVSPSINTQYSVTGTSSLGCKASNTLIVLVNPLPILILSSDTIEICLGKSATVNVSGASSFSWSTGVNSASITVSPTVSSQYSVTGTSSLGCNSTSTLIVLVNALPSLSLSISNSTLCEGESSTITVSGATSYSWSSGATGSVIVVSPSVTSNYTVSGVDQNGCENIANITQYISTCVGLRDLEVDPFKNIIVYPNPSNGIFYLTTKPLLKGGSIIVRNVLNEILFYEEILDSEVQINLHENSAGIYFIVVSGPDQNQSSIKIIKL